METSSKVDPLDNKDVNYAALTFKSCTDSIKAILSNPKATRDGVIRVLKAVVEFPLGTLPNFKHQYEKDLFTLTIDSLRAKHTMMVAVVESRKELEDKLKEVETGEVNGK